MYCVETVTGTGYYNDASQTSRIAEKDDFLVEQLWGSRLTTSNSFSLTGYQDGNALTAKFRSPLGIAVDSHDNLLVVDEANNVIRRINSDRTKVQTLAGRGKFDEARDGRGTKAVFDSPKFITTLKGGDFLVTDES